MIWLWPGMTCDLCAKDANRISKAVNGAGCELLPRRLKACIASARTVTMTVASSSVQANTWHCWA